MSDLEDLFNRQVVYNNMFAHVIAVDGYWVEFEDGFKDRLIMIGVTPAGEIMSITTRLLTDDKYTASIKRVFHEKDEQV